MPSFFNSITHPSNRPQLFLGLFLTAIGLARLTLIGSGACSQGDEFRYWYSAQMLLGASKMDLAAALSPMFDTAGRPGLALVQLPPVLLQSILFKLTGLDPRCPDSLLIPQVWNVAISVAGGWLFFKASHRVFNFSIKKSAWLTVAFSLLTASSIYVRHLLPYDMALYLFLGILLLIFKDKKAPFIGLLTAFAYSVYPGYYPLVFVVFLCFLYKKIDKILFDHKLIKPVLGFVAGFISLLLFYEILSRISGKSFIENSLFGGQEFLNYLQLKYDGSFYFLMNYLLKVESVPGMLLIFGSGLFFLKILAKTIARRPLEALDWVAIGLLAAFVFQAAIGQFSGMKVFYGRLMRPISMAMIWFSGAVLFIFLEKIDRFVLIKKAVGTVVLGCFLVKFFLFYVGYLEIGYPRDIFYQNGFSQKADGLGYDIRSKTPPNDGILRQNQFEPSSYFTLPPENSWHPRPKLGIDPTLLFLNFAAVPVPTGPIFNEFPKGTDFGPLVMKRHFAGFAPYYFEEDWDARQKSMMGRPLEIGIFKDKRLR